MAFDADPPDTLTAFLEGDIPFDHLLGGVLGASPANGQVDTRSRFEKDDVVPGGPLRDGRRSSGTWGVTVGNQTPAAREAMQALADMGYFDTAEPPMTSGHKALTVPIRSTPNPSLSARMTAGIRVFSETAMKVAEAQRMAAQARVDQETRIAALEAKQAAAAASRARRVMFEPVRTSPLEGGRPPKLPEQEHVPTKQFRLPPTKKPASTFTGTTTTDDDRGGTSDSNRTYYEGGV
jgi:hypothetical protein